MFKTLLIANRGEIACRIIRTCRAMGVRSVAVYSEADRDAVHVGLADEAVCIGPAEARLSYLDIGAILDAARETGAEAIHPGYGFVAENADFASACAAAGLTFVGPSPAAISRMGSKIEAKAVAEAIGVPVVPGYYGDDQSDQNLAAEAQRLGAPLLIKASAGGGGRGMRRVDDIADFANALASARAEALAAFGNGDVLLERYVERPRHIEVQLLCDRHGTALHLYERDCSVQRNHQKVIEEAPAPDLSAALRDRLTGDALKLATAIAYDSVGTVEFILDRDSGEIYFLEMNTRLQVEHPVTEMITGLDIVEWQIRVAAGQALPFAQSDIQIDGWAMEARVAAEDPAQAYRPQVGRVRYYRQPTGDNVRVDSGLEAGQEITPYYDSMIAKVIAHGPDRDAARTRLGQAAADMRIGGLGTNIAFLTDILSHADFAAADIDTTFIARAFADGWQAPTPTPRHLAAAARAFVRARNDAESLNPWQSLGAWRLTGNPGTGVVYVSQANAPPVAVHVTENNNENNNEDDDEDDIHVEGALVTIFESPATHEFSVHLPEQVLLGRAGARHDGGDILRAPMPGLVAAVLVEAGQRVEAGQTVVVLEAMKLMQDLSAPRDGVIATINCQPGDTVSGGAVLIEFETEEKNP